MEGLVKKCFYVFLIIESIDSVCCLQFCFAVRFLPAAV